MNWIKSSSTSSLKFASQKNKQKQFLWLISSLLTIITAYQFLNLENDYLLLSAAVISLIISFIVPILIFPFLYIWMLIGNILSEISSFIVLGIVYFLGFFTLHIFKMQQKTKKGWTDSEPTNFNEQY